jgi:hypothetical protein
LHKKRAAFKKYSPNAEVFQVQEYLSTAFPVFIARTYCYANTLVSGREFVR